MGFTAVGNIDTSGISMLDEVKKTIERRELKVLDHDHYSFYCKLISLHVITPTLLFIFGKRLKGLC